MEHGNLEINFEEKTKALEGRKYMLLLRKRQQNPDFKKRRIHIEYILEPEKVEYLIRDQGNGFNHEFFELRKHQSKKTLSLHGRGILLTRSIFDKVSYNKKGNEVKLIKKF